MDETQRKLIEDHIFHALFKGITNPAILDNGRMIAKKCSQSITIGNKYNCIRQGDKIYE